MGGVRCSLEPLFPRWSLRSSRQLPWHCQHSPRAQASGRCPLPTRLRYTTMVVLPEGEEILDVICGDKDFWVISSTHNIAHVKPAKEGAATNMNLVAASGAVYSFLLTEKSGNGMPDLKV